MGGTQTSRAAPYTSVAHAANVAAMVVNFMLGFVMLDTLAKLVLGVGYYGEEM